MHICIVMFFRKIFQIFFGDVAPKPRKFVAFFSLYLAPLLPLTNCLVIGNGKKYLYFTLV